MSNVICLKHPHYKGDVAPDLACKTCCSMFVGRIRAEQAGKRDQLPTPSTTSASFTPMVGPGEPVKPAVAKKPLFDSSWI